MLKQEATWKKFMKMCVRLTSEPDLSFNYAATEDLKKWGFSEGCFTCLLQDKKDTYYSGHCHIYDREGAKSAYDANVDYLKKNGYGNPVKAETLGESSILLKKKQNDGVTYNLIFFKNNVHAALSAKYKKDKHRQYKSYSRTC